MPQIGAGGGAPAAHKTTHQNGGTDEIDISGLTGATEIVDTPANGETTKGVSSNWAYDHKADPVAHHAAVDPGEGHIHLPPYAYNAVVQGTWVLAVNAALLLNYNIYDSGAAVGDEINWKAYLAPGTYTLGLLAGIATDRGIIDIKINGTVVATFDLYAASIDANHISTQTGIVVSTGGIKTITLKVTGKNASSTNYTAAFTDLWLYRTA